VVRASRSRPGAVDSWRGSCPPARWWPASARGSHPETAEQLENDAWRDDVSRSAATDWCALGTRRLESFGSRRRALQQIVSIGLAGVPKP
jgi:hypothetical protein